MASLRKRKGRWQARVIRKGCDPIAKTFDTKLEAEKWARGLERDIDQGNFRERNEAQTTTLGDLLRRYREQVTPKKRGWRAEEYSLQWLEKHRMASLPLASLTAATFAEFRDERLLNVSGGTVARALALVSAVLTLARREWNILVGNPIADIRKPIGGRSRDRILDLEEEQRLLVELDTGSGVRDPQGRFAGPRNPWIKPLVEFALETAMRRSELLGLRWEHINLTKRTAFLAMTKNGSSRTVPLSGKAVEVINALPRSIDGRVFPLTAPAVRDCFVRACRRAGVRNFRFHDLRHCATTRLAERLPNVIELAAVTGHKSLAMLHRYYHTRPEDLARKLA